MRLSKAQLELVDELEKGFGIRQNAIVGWYTGSGKTVVIDELISRLVKSNPKLKIGVCTHFYKTLRDQISSRLSSEVIIDRKLYDKDNGCVFVFNAQHIYRSADYRNKIEFDLLIVDESHDGLNEDTKMINSIMKKSKSKILLSATCWDLLDMFPTYTKYLRGIGYGAEDGRLGEVEFNLHHFDGEVFASDINCEKNLSTKYLLKNRDMILKFMEAKLKELISDRRLGSKVLVIVPPNGYVDKISAFLKCNKVDQDTSEEEQQTIDDFRKDVATRFLVVVRKCNIGFDMPELTDVVDLTMTRNIKQIVQRIGRVTREHMKLLKRYHYVYDDRMGEVTARALMIKAIEFANCVYSDDDKVVDIVGKENIKPVGNFTIGSVLGRYKLTTENQIKISLSRNFEWTLESALEEIKKYTTRNEFVNGSTAYQFMLRNHPDILNKLLPTLHTAYTLDQAVHELKQYTERVELLIGKRKNARLYNYMLKYHRELFDELLPSIRSSSVSRDEVFTFLSTYKDKKTSLPSKVLGAIFSKFKDDAEIKNLYDNLPTNNEILVSSVDQMGIFEYLKEYIAKHGSLHQGDFSSDEMKEHQRKIRFLKKHHKDLWDKLDVTSYRERSEEEIIEEISKIRFNTEIPQYIRSWCSRHKKLHLLKSVPKYSIADEIANEVRKLGEAKSMETLVDIFSGKYTKDQIGHALRSRNIEFIRANSPEDIRNKILAVGKPMYYKEWEKAIRASSISIRESIEKYPELKVFIKSRW